MFRFSCCSDSTESLTSARRVQRILRRLSVGACCGVEVPHESGMDTEGRGWYLNEEMDLAG